MCLVTSIMFDSVNHVDHVDFDLLVRISQITNNAFVFKHVVFIKLCNFKVLSVGLLDITITMMA